MSFMRQLEEYREFSDHRDHRKRSRSRSSGRSDERKSRKPERSRRRSRSRSDRSRSSSRSRHRSRRSRSSSVSSSDDVSMERCISDKPTPVVLARGITEYMKEPILREAIVTSGFYPRDIFIARKRRTGHVRGFGYIEFYNEDDARRWLDHHQGTFYLGEDRLSLLYCIPSESPFAESGTESRSSEWNCLRCGKFNTWRDQGICYRCGSRRDGLKDRALRSVEKPTFDRIGRAPCNTILIRDLDTNTISERTIKAVLYEQQRVASSSIRSCFVMRNPPVTDVTKSTSCCYAFIELQSTHEATQLIDRLHSKPLVMDGKQVQASFARYPFTTIMANIQSWLASASENPDDQEATSRSYVPNQADVTNAAAAVAMNAMMARQQVEVERAKRRAKRRERAERKREKGESSRGRPSSASSYSSDEDDADSDSLPSAQVSLAAAAAAASSSISQQFGINVGLPALGNSAAFQFDPATGYYYDASTGSYFDPKTRYFYSPNLQQWLTWDSTANQYVPVAAQNPASETALASQQQSEQVAPVETDEMKKERERKEKAKEARKIHKEMEKWAKGQGSNNDPSSSGKRPPESLATTTAPSTTSQSLAPASTADTAYSFMQSSTSSSDEAALLESSVTHLLSLLDWDDIICKLCARKLSTDEQLRKHCAHSALHKSNASSWCQKQGLSSSLSSLVIETVARAVTDTAPQSQTETAPQVEQSSVDFSYVYRDRAKERRQKSRGHLSGGKDSYGRYETPAATVSLNQPVSGIGQKLISKMGWQGGGLGKNEQGRVDPIEAERRQSRAGLGNAGVSTRATEHLDYREAAKRTLFSRFHELG